MILELLVIGSGLTLLVCIANQYQQKRFKQMSDQIAHQSLVIAEAKHNNQEILQQITVLQTELDSVKKDPVTHFIGKEEFINQLDQSIILSKRSAQLLSVLLINIDNFKWIQSALTIDMCHAVLSEVATRFQDCLREVDIMACLSPDLYACQLSMLSRPETTALVVQRILLALEPPIIVAEQEIYITIKVGIALYPQDAKTAGELLRCAEIALIKAKQNNNQIYQFYHLEMQEQSIRELMIRSAIRSEEFFKQLHLRYHPVIDIKNECLFCVKLEVMWRHPKLGDSDEKTLDGLIEQHDLFVLYYSWLFEQAAKQFIAWRSVGVNPSHILISITMKHLENQQLIHRLAQVLNKFSIKPESIILSVYDVQPTVSYDILEKSINMLKYMGVQLAIQNFGDQGCPLSYFNYFNIFCVVLDERVTASVVQDTRSHALLASVLKMMDHLSIPVVVQGVHSPVMLDTLKSMGIHLVQGQIAEQSKMAQVVHHDLVF